MGEILFALKLSSSQTTGISNNSYRRKQAQLELFFAVLINKTGAVVLLKNIFPINDSMPLGGERENPRQMVW
jgi:hypothetical protein